MVDYDPQRFVRRLDKYLPGYVPPVRKPHKDPYDEFTNPRKLDVALKLDIIQDFRAYVRHRGETPEDLDDDSYNPRYELLLRTPGIPPLSSMCSDGSFLPKVILELLYLTKESTPSAFSVKRMKRVFATAHSNIKFQLDYNMASVSEKSRELYEAQKDEYLARISSPPAELSVFIDAFYALRDLVDKIPEGYIPSHMKNKESIQARIEAILLHETNSAKVRGLPIRAWWSGDICVLEVHESAYLMPTSILPEVWNKVADHISVLIYAWMAEGTYLEPGSYRKTVDFLRIFHKRHVHHPASFFAIAGGLEALCTAILVSRHDQWESGPNEEFLTATLSDLADSCKEAGDPPITIDHELVQALLDSSSPLVSELGCLAKMSGHPLTSTEAGMLKLHERTTRPRTIKVEAVAWTVQSLKREFLKEYFSVHGHYPPGILCSSLTCARLRACFSENKEIDDPSLNIYGSYSTEDFATLTIQKFEELDYLDNILPYLKDKAASVTASKVWKRYIHEGGRGEPGQAREEKLLLMYVLGSPDEIDHVTYIKEFERHEGAIKDFMEQLAIRLVPKEKELKPVARLFGCMTYKNRAATQVVLRFMQRYLKRYCSSQAMVVTELELTKKLYAFTKKKSLGGGMRAFSICMDAEGWNNAFTKETVGPVLSQTIDAMLGSQLPSRLHETFEHTLFYAKEKGRVIYYEGQNGGIEGLQQGSWMLVYVQQIRYALRLCVHHYDILIKGDDVRVRFEVPIEDVPYGQEEPYLREMRKMAVDGLAEFGHKIKTLDSYYSENVLVFSKKTFIHGVALPSSYRQIQKTYGANNAFMFTTDDSVGAAFSNAHSASGYGVNCLAPYVVALFWSLIHALGEAPYRSLTDHELLALTLTPSALGGFPIIYLHNMYVRAESDLVSAFCGVTLFAKEWSTPLFNILEKVGNYKLSARDCLVLLVEDPYALPRAGHTSPHATLRTKLTETLKIHARNPSVRALFSAEVTRFKEYFVNAIRSADRYDTKLINAIYECTICAIQEKMLQKFTSAKSIVQHIYSMVHEGREVRGLCKRLLYERQRRDLDICAIVRRFNGKRVGVLASTFSCPTAYAEELRNVGWGKPVDGITYPPPQHQVRIFHDSETTAADVGRCFVYEVEEGHRVDEHLKPVHFWVTNAEPYLGHHTPSGTIAAPVDMENPDLVIQSIKRLLMISTLSILEDESDKPDGAFTFYDVVLHLLSLYTNASVSDLEMFVHKRKSGTRTHHLVARSFRLGILPNMVKNLMSHVRGQVNTYTALRATSDNFRINFMQLYVHTGVLLNFNWFLPNTCMNSGRFKSTIPDCQDCFIPIREPNTYMTDRSLLDFSPILPLEYEIMVTSASEVIAMAMSDDMRENDVREIVRTGDITTEEACQVVAGEFFSSSLMNFSRMSLSYTIIRPTAERLQDKMMMKGRQGRSRDVTGSELIKIPAPILVQQLKEAVYDYTFRYKTLTELDEIHVAYMLADPRTLPWATVMSQLQRHGKLQAVIAEVCEQVGLPFSSGANACRDYGAASAFVGKHLATRALSASEPSARDIVVAEFIKGASLHLLIQRKRLARLVWLVHNNLIVDIEHEFMEDFAWGEQARTVLSILTLATYPSWSVKEITEMFQETPSNRVVSLVGEVYSQWYLSYEMIKARMSEEAYALLSIWTAGSSFTVDDMFDYLLDIEQGFRPDKEEFEETCGDLDLYCRVIFRDLASSYQLVRALPVPEDLDDFSGQELPTHARTVTNFVKSDLVEGEKLERVWKMSVEKMDWGPYVSDPDPEEIQSVKIDFTHMARAYGFSTSAWIKTARILEATGHIKAWRNIPINICCLADGDGGDSRWMADFFPRSRVVWNSLNADIVSGVSNPLATRVIDPETGNLTAHRRILSRTQTLEGGDLTKPHIIDLLKDESSGYDIVKHDASLPFGRERTSIARSIWGNVLDLWVTTGTPNSIMIQKVFTDLPESLAWLLGRCRINSKRCSLIVLRESHCSHEAYVVCQNPIRPIKTVLPSSSGPGYIRRITYEAAHHNQQMIADCLAGISQRELMIKIPSPILPVVETPLKAMTTLPEIGVDHRFAENLPSVSHELANVVHQLKGQVQGGNIQFEDINQPGDTFTHLAHIMGRYVFWESCRVVIDCFSPYFPIPQAGCSAAMKKTIYDRVENELRGMTSSPRWTRLGGPFTPECSMTRPVQMSSRRRLEPSSLPFAASYSAGVKLGMEVIAGVLATEADPEQEIPMPRRERWEGWTSR